MAKAQPAKKAAKTVQKKATSVAKTARKTVRCAPQHSCNSFYLVECNGGPLLSSLCCTPSCGSGDWRLWVDPIICLGGGFLQTA